MARNFNTPYLVEDTSSIGRDRRIEEQAGTRAVTGARVQEKDHAQDYLTTLNQGQEYLEENGVEAHPILARNQAYDGRDDKLSVDTTLNPEARAEIENQLRLQQQLKLQKQQELTSTFNPKPY